MKVANVVDGWNEKLEDIRDCPAIVLEASTVVDAKDRDRDDAEPAALLLVITGMTKTVELMTTTESDIEVVAVLDLEL